MLTYQLQKRIFKIKGNKNLSFPNNAEIEINLEPTEMLGIGDKLSKTGVKNHETKIFFNAFNGKSGVRSNPPLEPIEVIFKLEKLQLELHGNKLSAKAHCENFNDLNQLLVILHYIVPILLNIELAEAPVVKMTCGRVADIPFSWELESTKFPFDMTTKEKQEQRVVDSFNRLSIISGTSNRRLAAAMYYFYVARRLKDAGNSPYEFMSEIILNLHKVLEILFGPKREIVRTKLLELGYSQDEIELKFIPIMLLRNEFDVGHVSIDLFTQEQLNALYSYVEATENDFRDLLKRVINKVESGSYSLKVDSKLNPNKGKLKILNRLINNIEKRSKQC